MDNIRYCLRCNFPNAQLIIQYIYKLIHIILPMYRNSVSGITVVRVDYNNDCSHSRALFYNTDDDNNITVSVYLVAPNRCPDRL